MPHNVAHFLAEQAIRHPAQAAVRAPSGRCPEGTIRYKERNFAELENESSSLAYHFQAKGIQRGTRVLLMVRPGLDLIRTVFALFKIGAVPIVIDPGMGLSRFLRCVQDSKPEALIGIFTARIVAYLARRSFAAVHLRLGPKPPPKAVHKSFPAVNSAPDELAAILFTSGSTGPAKGVCYEHGMFAAQIEAIRAGYNIEAGEIDLPMLPVFALFNPALGMCTVVPEMNPSRPAQVDPQKIVQAIQQNKVTNSFGSPALWAKITRHCIAKNITLPGLRRILLAGASVPPTLLTEMQTVFPGTKLHTPYGATEALPLCTIEASEILEDTAVHTRAGAGSCVGTPLPEVEIRIIQSQEEPIADISDTKNCPTGTIGEIIAYSPTATRAYHHLPEATARAKIKDGERYWHRMSDLGKLDEHGRLWFCGRQAESVETDSGICYPDCCEAIINQHPRVFRSALIAFQKKAALVIEPEMGAFPKNPADRLAFKKELRELCLAQAMTAEIHIFFFQKKFPVDVRHNAKIHRLSLSRKWNAKERQA
ncbi:MAG: Long-chain-fatty-acid--CoA ligase [Opitutia bacterium UBA7350]|nr:MAG: Long-chain-fatty-acid--CoA ligase [Opitutae bacterium UBA7350]